jgi:hypothetical protein
LNELTATKTRGMQQPLRPVAAPIRRRLLTWTKGVLWNPFAPMAYDRGLRSDAQGPGSPAVLAAGAHDRQVRTRNVRGH